MLSRVAIPVILALLLAACHKKPPAAVAPAPVNYLRVGDKHFDSGEYAQAVQAYQAHLRSAGAPDPDHALFRQALSYSFDESSVRDPARATHLLQQLVSRFPQSAFAPQARLLLRLYLQVEALRSDVVKRDERIRAIAQELERLKQVDMQRRPTRPK